jgi:peptidyl-prolyl cis-trans isomerase A (cyclophilin A)
MTQQRMQPWLQRIGQLALVSLALAASQVAMAQNVKIATSMGDIVVQLDAAKAPKTVDNFVQYVKAGHYNGTIFHRVIDGFMVQGGGMTPDMKEKPTRGPIPLESKNGLSNVRGTLAMARTNVPDSATAQFFINVKDNNFLDSARSPDGNGYAVFGKVISGMDVVDKIRKVETGQKGPHGDVPLQPITIKQATIEK